MNPFNIREAGQTIIKALQRVNAVSIPSTSGKPVRLKPRSRPPSWSLNPFNIREAGQTRQSRRTSGTLNGLNPFNIREAGQTDAIRKMFPAHRVSIPSTSGKPVRPRKEAERGCGMKSQSLQHQGSRSDCPTGTRRAVPHDVSIPSTSGKPVRRIKVVENAGTCRSQSLQHQGSRSDKVACSRCRSVIRLNPFNIREAGQTRASS